MLDNIKLDMVDARELQRLYRSTQNSLKAEVTIPNILTLPPIDGVDQSFLGFIAADQYLKLITDEHGNIRKTVFYDNVRDFQGDNKVNGKIALTLSSLSRSEFVIRNNGVTVVAKSLTRTGNSFSLVDYQIVNGCQTSHVVFANSSNLDSSVAIPIKIIATLNEETTRGIIEATNSQTEVSDEQLKSLSDYQRTLEDHFATYSAEQKIFYERRSKQYANVTGIEKTRIISIPYQIKSFSAMFLDDPHRAGRYFATLRKLHDDKLFKSTDKPEVYYTAAFAAYRLEYLFRNNLLDPRFKAVRYHLLMALRITTANSLDVPPTNSRAMANLCSRINAIMWDADAALVEYVQLGHLIGEALTNSGINLDRDSARSQDSTDAILRRMKASLVRA